MIRFGSRKILFCSAIGASLACGSALAGNVVSTPTGLQFQEDFRFQGNHAATLPSGQASTVWWDEASWDVRGDTAFSAVTPISASINNRFHIDIHKALNTNPADARLSNTVLAVGGDGSAGVGIMHLDFQDIISARLRNPMQISAAQPGEVSFYAPIFNSTGHWWEIAITPADKIVGGEHTSVPGQGEFALPGPLVNSSAQPGPGHGPAADSINVISFGASDVPCDTGWQVRFGVSKTVAGNLSHAVNQVPNLSNLLQTSPEQANRLVHWRVRFAQTGIELAADPEEDGSFAVLETYAMAVPWNEVHVHLMAVAYQADHHPQGDCYLGHIREVAWRAVKVSPVKYAATDVYPKNANADQAPAAAWRGYDLRDIQRFGAAINGVPQPNLSSFSVENSGRYCNDAGYPCFDDAANASLSLVMPTRPGLELASAAFLYDARDRDGATTSGSLGIGALAAQNLPGHDSVPAAESQAWVRRALALNPQLLGANSTHQLNIALQQGSYIDRMEVEFGFSSPSVLFANGYESPVLAAQPQALLKLESAQVLDGGSWQLDILNAQKVQGMPKFGHCSAHE